MVRSLCVRGNHEGLKCGVHGAATVLAGLCAAYNIAAWCFRRDRHLRVNAILYTVAVMWEIKQTLRHFSARGTCLDDAAQADALVPKAA